MAAINWLLFTGGFLSDAGWFAESSKVLQCCKNLCLTLPDDIHSWRKTLECCHKYEYICLFNQQSDLDYIIYLTTNNNVLLCTIRQSNQTQRTGQITLYRSIFLLKLKIFFFVY